MEHQPPHRDGAGPRPPLIDTIVAAATPPGRGGVAIVRLSGPAVPQIASAICSRLPLPRQATRATFQNEAGEALDHGLALYFPAPNSYTGEHVLELHGHGGPVLVEGLIARALQLGARRAQPGEFTQRAYLNGKLDLAQAEAVADLIDAASGAAARAALRSLEGEFSDRVRSLHEALGDLRAHVEAAIDFADEDIDALSERALGGRLAGILADLAALQAASRRGRLLNEGLTVVIAGRPNAGKSTLLNRLAGHEAAIVTDIPGTTRDILRERIVIDGLPLQVLDTAGLRAADDHSQDAIEREGIRRAQAAFDKADRILFVIDGLSDPQAQAFEAERTRLPAGVPVTLLINKSDQAGALPPADLDAQPPRLHLSALHGHGLEGLRAHLLDVAGIGGAEEGTLSARARHVEALARTEQILNVAMRELQRGVAPELVAEEIRRAQQTLGEILGVESTEELLGRIFSSFCIGK